MPRVIPLNAAARELLLAGFREGQPIASIQAAVADRTGLRVSERSVRRWASAWRADQALLEESILGAFRAFVNSPSRATMEGLKQTLLQRLFEYQVSAYNFPASRKGNRAVSKTPARVSKQLRQEDARALLAQKESEG